MENNEENQPINKDKTLTEQKAVESQIETLFKLENFDVKNPDKFNKEFEFDIEGHVNFAKNMILYMPSGYSQIDAGLPWFSYWVLNIVDVCGCNKYELSYTNKMKFVNYLKELQHEDGGFSGYVKGLPHIASNYAAIMAILNLGIKEAYEIIDRQKMKNFLKRMKNNNIDNKLNKNTSKFDRSGSFLIETDDINNCSKFKANWPGTFQMHENGESDLRATYCATIVAYILNILDAELTEGVIENIKLCQTFEGGLGPEPFCEAHGGYSFCGIATLVILNKLDEIDVDRFIRWIVNRQMRIEGGFQGRTNKLVDSCYSFWQASVFNLLLMNGNEKKFSFDCELLYDQLALQAYILLCCQYNSGGLIDKPGRKPDLFHTNYASIGLALSQKCTLKGDEFGDYKVSISESDTLNFGEINPIFSILNEKVDRAKDYFWNLN